MPPPFSASDTGCGQEISVLLVCLGFQPGPLGPGLSGVKRRAVMTHIVQLSRHWSPGCCPAVFLPLPMAMPGSFSCRFLLSYTRHSRFSEEYECCCTSSVWQLHFTAVKATAITVNLPASLSFTAFSLWI